MVRVPWGDVNCLPIPDSVPDEAALYLSDMLPTSYHTVVDTGVKDGDCVAVWGAGPMRVAASLELRDARSLALSSSSGLLCAHWAFLKGAKRVFLIGSLARLPLTHLPLTISPQTVTGVWNTPSRRVRLLRRLSPLGTHAPVLQSPKSRPSIFPKSRMFRRSSESSHATRRSPESMSRWNAQVCCLLCVVLLFVDR